MNLDQEIESLIKFNDIHPKDMTKEKWLEDFNSFYEIMKENYPYLYVKERILGYNWLDLKNNYIKRLEKAKEVKEYLEIFFDAVTALQDSHTSIQLPHWFLDYFFKEGGFAQSYFMKFATYRRIFTEELKKASEYWKPIIKEFYEERTGIDYDALILYSKGEYRIFDGYGSWEQKYGHRTVIKAVNGTPIDDAVKESFEKGYLFWDVKRKKPYLLYIDPKIFGRKTKFTIETNEGEIKEVVFETSKDYNYTFAQAFNYPSELFTTKIWSGNKLAYIRFGNFEGDSYDDETFEFLKAFYEKVKNFEHLIIDIRGNSGGMKETWMNNIIAPLAKKKLTSKMYAAYHKGKYVHMFRKDRGYKIELDKKELVDFPPETLTDDYSVYDASITVEPLGEIPFNAKISLLVDNITYSASIAFTLFCKDTGFAKVYGTPTKGEGIGSGTIFYVLPNSKILIRFFPELGINSKGNACEEMKVQPDVYYESELRNFDELINFVIEDLNK